MLEDQRAVHKAYPFDLERYSVALRWEVLELEPVVSTRPLGHILYCRVAIRFVYSIGRLLSVHE